jgi:hypothetical protein
LPGIAYILLLYRLDPVFAAQNRTLSSPAPMSVIQGYGLILLLAASELVRLSPISRSASEAEERLRPLKDESARMLLTAWMLGTLVAMYLPFPFQEKLMEGVHIPMAVLASACVYALLDHRAGSMPRTVQQLSTLCIVLFLSISSMTFVVADVRCAQRNRLGAYRAYLLPGEVAALRYAGSHMASDRSLQPIPWIRMSPDNNSYQIDSTLLQYAPALSGKSEYAGHWSETDDNERKVSDVLRSVTGPAGSARKEEILRSARIEYLIFSQKTQWAESAAQIFPAFTGRAKLPPYLELVYSNRDADVYRVRD